MAKKIVSIHPEVEVFSSEEDGVRSKNVIDGNFKKKPPPQHIRKNAEEEVKDQQSAAYEDRPLSTEEERLQEALTQAKLERNSAYSGDALREDLLERYRELQNFKQEFQSVSQGTFNHKVLSGLIKNQSKKLEDGKKLYESTVKNGPSAEEKERVDSNEIQAKQSLDQYYKDTAISSTASESDVKGAEQYNESLANASENTRPNNLNKGVMIAKGNEVYKALPNGIEETPIAVDAPRPRAPGEKKEAIVGILKKAQGAQLQERRASTPYSAAALAAAKSAERQ